MKTMLLFVLLICSHFSNAQCWMTSEITRDGSRLSVPDTFLHYEWFKVRGDGIPQLPLLSASHVMSTALHAGDTFICFHWKNEKCITSHTMYVVPATPVQAEKIIYPNPATDYIRTNYDTFIAVYDIRTYLMCYSSTPYIDISTLPRGTYIVETNAQRAQVVIR